MPRTTHATISQHAEPSPSSATRRRPPSWQTLCCYRVGPSVLDVEAIADTAARVRADTAALVVAVLNACAPRGQDADQVAAVPALYHARPASPRRRGRARFDSSAQLSLFE